MPIARRGNWSTPSRIRIATRLQVFDGVLRPPILD
jgi:hypothetical protein